MDNPKIKPDDIVITKDEPSDKCYEGLISCLGGSCGCIMSYILCCFCCTPYKTVDQGHELVITRFGRYKETKGAGFHYLRPFTDEGRDVSKMVHVIDLPEQNILTQDNVSANIDGSVYYKIVDSYKAIFTIEKLEESVNQLALSALRSCFAIHTLQDCLQHRDKLETEIKKYVETFVLQWGIIIDSIVIKDIKLSKEMQAHLSVKASSIREAEAKVINAQGDVDAAKLFRQASDILNTPSALQIRQLEAMKAMAASANTKVIFVPTTNIDNLTSMSAAMAGVKQ